MNAILLFQQQCMRIFLSSSPLLSFSLARSLARSLTFIVVDSCTWHTSVILIVSARDTSVGAHIALWTPRFTPVCPSVHSFVHPAAQRSINVRKKNDIVVFGLDHLADRTAHPAGPYLILYGSLRSDLREASRESG